MSDNPVAWCRILDLDFATLDVRSLKTAYAKKIKTIDAAADREGFQAVRTAYEGLIPFAKRKTASREAVPGLNAKPTPPPSLPKPEPSPKTPRTPPPDERSKPRSAPPKNSATPPNIGGRQDFSAIDRKAVSELIAKASACLKSPWATDALSAVLDDPLMDQMAVAVRVERAIGYEIVAFGRQPDRRHDLPPGLNRKALEALERRFAWYSDIARMRKTFGFNAQHLLHALMLSPHRPTGELGMQRNIQRVAPQRKDAWRHTFVNLISFPWFVSSFFIVFLTFGFSEMIFPYVFP